MKFSTQHRPWALPSSPWVMAQTWHDLLFAHWPVPIEQVRAHISAPLEIDTFEGRAWIGVVPFRMSGVRLRGTPALPWVSAFPEMNVRTYVKMDNKPGVYFFSLDATNPLAVATARAWFKLPYHNARMSLKNTNGTIDYQSVRKSTADKPVDLTVSYRPTGDVFKSVPGTLEYWLTERYCLYTAGPGRVARGEIHHNPWPLQPAEARFTTNTMTAPLSIVLPDQPPRLHFAGRLDVVLWPPMSL